MRGASPRRPRACKPGTPQDGIRRTTPCRARVHMLTWRAQTEGRKWLSWIFMADGRRTNEALRCCLPGSSAGRVCPIRACSMISGGRWYGYRSVTASPPPTWQGLGKCSDTGTAHAGTRARVTTQLWTHSSVSRQPFLGVCAREKRNKNTHTRGE
jgi:hypothetical protein